LAPWPELATNLSNFAFGMALPFTTAAFCAKTGVLKAPVMVMVAATDRAKVGSNFIMMLKSF
jgi:hypothetical protein